MTDSSLWQCPQCGTTNAPDATGCVVCDAWRPGSEHADPTVLFGPGGAPLASPGPSASVLHCHVCGAAVGTDRHFCSQCGTRVTSPALIDLQGSQAAPRLGPASVPDDSHRGRSTVWALSGVFAVLLVAVLVLGVVLFSRSDQISSTGPVVPTVAPTTTSASSTTTAPTTALAPTTVVITVPPTPANASAAQAPAGTPTPVLDALDLAQELATALAHDDWAKVRQLEPGKSNLADSQFYAQYNDLDESTAILVSAGSQGGGSYSLRLGLVAHQNGSQTSLYCVTWIVDTSSRHVVESSAGTRSLLNHGAGTLDPLSQADRLRTECRW